MSDIMKLATDYAQACYNLANPDSYDAERAEEARAALQSAIEALQTECADHKENAVRNARIAVSIRAERDQLQAKLDAAPKALAPLTDEQELWLWQNGDHMLAFKHLYPCFTEGGDPMTLGEPVARAIFKTSHDRSGGAPWKSK